jgi:hypothetical protein
MSTDRDTTRLVRSWLEEGVTALPDRILDAVLDQVPATPQRRSWSPARRFAQMNNVRIAIAAAAVVVVAVIGYNLLPRSDSLGAQPTPIPSPTTTPGPSALPAVVPARADIPPGTYRVLSSFTNMPLQVTLPAGWGHTINDGNFISKGDVFEGNGVSFATWLVSHVYRDSCQWQGTLREAQTATAIVTALTEQVGHATSQATIVSLGGQPATRIEFSLDAAFDVATCDGPIVRLWPDAGPDERFGLPISPGQTTTVYVVDHGANATLVVGIRNQDSPPGDVTELEAVLASVQFEG